MNTIFSKHNSLEVVNHYIRLLNYHMLLANRIRLLRIARGYSQEYMADRLGISQAAYSKLERRAGNSTVYTLEKVANVLGVTLVFLVDVNNKEVF